MRLKSFLGIFLGKIIIFLSRLLNIGYGGTWPGEIALLIDKNILQFFSSKIDNNIILVAGTNGKTTTSLLIKSILEKSGYSVVHNISGANLVNGLVSAFIDSSDFFANNLKNKVGIFEIDENSLPLALNSFAPKIIVCLNLFRDQLDRYGEVDVIADKWKKAFSKLSKTSIVLLNSDDPQIAYLGKNLNAKTIYFGINDKEKLKKDIEHATDSIFCLNCHKRLIFKGYYYSHIGIWECKNCHLKRPEPKYSKYEEILPGFYNKYNVLASVAACSELGVSEDNVKKGLENFAPAFGRQEKFNIKGKQITIFLSKNPAGFNMSLSTVIEMGAREILLVLNDRIPDGRDVSWIWDVDFEKIPNSVQIAVSGDRVYDLTLRLDYSKDSKSLLRIYENLEEVLNYFIKKGDKKNPLYVLATYSAMLETRKILSGRKIL